MPFLASSEKKTDDGQRVNELNAIAGKKKADVTEIKFQLGHSLQSSLDVQDTLASFYRAVQNLIPIGGMEYSYNKRQIHIHQGSTRAHNLSYNLIIQEYELGQIKFFRGKRFSKQEIETLEVLISVLIMPLRNALLYLEALENSLRDSLTRAGNRAALEICLKRELNLAERNGCALSLLVVDIDHFKSINDKFGHAQGDQVLVRVAQAISKTLRQTDQVFRFGGEEFVIVLSNTRYHDALIIAERIRIAVADADLTYEDQQIGITVSLGVSSKKDGDKRDQLFQRADKALYAAKEHGRNCVIGETDLRRVKDQPKAC